MSASRCFLEEDIEPLPTLNGQSSALHDSFPTLVCEGFSSELGQKYLPENRLYVSKR